MNVERLGVDILGLFPSRSNATKYSRLSASLTGGCDWLVCCLFLPTWARTIHSNQVLIFCTRREASPRRHMDRLHKVSANHASGGGATSPFASHVFAQKESGEEIIVSIQVLHGITWASNLRSASCSNLYWFSCYAVNAHWRQTILPFLSLTVTLELTSTPPSSCTTHYDAISAQQVQRDT